MKYPYKIKVKGRKVSDLVKALSQFPKNTDVELRRQWKQSYILDEVFIIIYDRDLRTITVEEIY